MIRHAPGDSNPVWFINRGVVVVRAQQPYADWANGLDDDGVSYGEATRWVNAYLIPEFEVEEESLEWLRDNCSLIFELELGAWHTDPDDWPVDRSWQEFSRWFDVEFIDLAWDLVDEPLSSQAPPPRPGPRLVD